MANGWLIAAGVSALLEWVAEALDNSAAQAVFKPSTLALLIVAFTVTAGSSSAEPIFAIATLALVGSLIGDVFLLRKDLNLIEGIGAFLVSQVAYVLAFCWDGAQLSSAALSAGALVLVVSGLYFRVLQKSLVAKDKRKLIAPVAIYTLILSAMLWSTIAAFLNPHWNSDAGKLALIGGLAFYVSDALLAWTQFVSDFHRSHLVVMFFYHCAQFSIASSLALHLTAS